MHLASLILYLLGGIFLVEGKRFTSRIYGGFDISIERVPYYVQILKQYKFNCGGSILKQQVILTAGHCGLKPGPYHVIVGSDQVMEGNQIPVKEFVIHPDYSENPITHNDVGLIFLETKLQYSTKIQPSFIPNAMTELPATDTPLLVVGLGVALNNPDPPFLQGIFLPMLDEKICHDLLKKENATEFSTQFCLGNLTIQGRDACNGDSGSPVTYNGIQYGLVSWGNGCGQKGEPGYYSNLITLNSWIRQTAKNKAFYIP